MPIDNSLANMQTHAQSNPAAALNLDALDAMEAFPDALSFLNRQPWPLIAHPDARLPVIYVQARLDRAICWRVFERIRQVVGHGLPDALSISSDKYASISREPQNQRAVWGGLALLLYGFAENDRQISHV